MLEPSMEQGRLAVQFATPVTEQSGALGVGEKKMHQNCKPLLSFAGLVENKQIRVMAIALTLYSATVKNEPFHLKYLRIYMRKPSLETNNLTRSFRKHESVSLNKLYMMVPCLPF